MSDFVSGGELHDLLRAYCVLPIVLVQIYVAQIALTLGKSRCCFVSLVNLSFCFLFFDKSKSMFRLENPLCFDFK